MSKGLGKVEREILTVFRGLRINKIKVGFPIIRLTNMIYGNTYLRLTSKATHSQYSSVSRAVNSLKRKNYVRVTSLKSGQRGFYSPSLGKKRKATRIKIVKPGILMYEEEKWLAHYKRFDMSKKKEGLPGWYKKPKTQ